MSNVFSKCDRIMQRIHLPMLFYFLLVVDHWKKNTVLESSFFEKLLKRLRYFFYYIKVPQHFPTSNLCDSSPL